MLTDLTAETVRSKCARLRPGFRPRLRADLHPQNKDPHRGRSGQGAQNGQVLLGEA